MMVLFRETHDTDIARFAYTVGRITTQIEKSFEINLCIAFVRVGTESRTATCRLFWSAVGHKSRRLFMKFTALFRKIGSVWRMKLTMRGTIASSAVA